MAKRQKEYKVCPDCGGDMICSECGYPYNEPSFNHKNSKEARE